MLVMLKSVAAFLVLTMIQTGAVTASSQGALNGTEAKSVDIATPFKKCWEYQFENIVKRAIASTNGTIYLSEPDGKVRAISAKSGQVLWVTELGGDIAASLAIPGVGLAVVTGTSSTGAKLRLLNFDTGLVRFSSPIAVSGEVFLGRSGSRLVAVDSDGSIGAYDSANGSTLWSKKLGSGVKIKPIFTDNSVAVPTVGKTIELILTRNGQALGTIKTDHPVTALAFRENESIVAGDERGNVTNYRDASGGVWWRFKSGAKIGTILQTEEGMLVGSYDNFLYLISNYSGDVKWKRRMGSRLADDPFVSKSQLFLTVSVEDTALSIDLATGKIIEQIELGENKYAMSSPVLTDGSMLVFSIPDAIVAYSNSPCVSK